MSYPPPFQNPLAQGGQPRHGQQPNPHATKQHGAQGPHPPQGFQNPYTYDPQLSFWILKRPIQRKNGLPASWKQTVPQNVRVPQAELQEDVDKFHQKKYTVKDVLSGLDSREAREVVNDHVEQENRELWKLNPTIQWNIACIKVKQSVVRIFAGKKMVDTLIELVLQTEPNPMAAVLDFQDPSRTKQQPMGHDAHRPQGGNLKQGGAQVPKHGQNPGQPSQHVDPQAFHKQPPHQPPQGPGHVQGQFQGPDQSGFGPPPPPPQHGGPPFAPPPDFGPPPPPQTGPPKQTQEFRNQPNPHQPMKPMPGAFPESGGYPQMRQEHQRPQPVEIIDVRSLHKQKSKSHMRDERDFDSSSESGSSSGDSRFITRPVEDGAYYNIERQGRRSRSRHQSRGRARSSSRGHDRGSKSYSSRSHGRRMSDTEHLRSDKYGSSPKATSPRTSHNALPQNNININVVGGGAEQERERESDHKTKRGSPQFGHVDYNPRRSSQSISPTGFSTAAYPTAGYKKSEKYDAPFMSRNSSRAGSDTGMSSFDNSSVHSTADDSVFSEPDPARFHSRTVSEAGGPTLRSRALPRPSYNDHYASQANSLPRHRRGMHSSADYQRPRGGSEQFGDYPEPQFPPSPPVRYRPRPERSMSYNIPPREMVHPAHTFHQPPRQIDLPAENNFDLRELAEAMDALEYIKDSRRYSRPGPPRRSNSVQVGRRGVPMPVRDQWANSGHFEPGYAQYDEYGPY